MDDEASLHERRLGQVAGVGFVPGRAALQRDDAFEAVASVGRGGESEPAAVGAVRTQVSKDTAGRWWHSSTTTRP